MIKEVRDATEKEEICKEILNALPQWFGIPEAIEDYIHHSKGMVFYAHYENNKPIGFIALDSHNASTLEIHVMGIKEEYHRKGIGRALVRKAESYAKGNNYQLLEVKTLAETHPDLNYKKTREFYKAIGFLPVEILPELWGKENPCLIMIKPL